MQQQHIAYGSNENGEQHIPFPDMKPAGHQNGEQFRDAVAALKYGNIPQAVHDEHAENGRRRKFQRAAKDEHTHKHRINTGKARNNGQGMWKCSL